MTRPKHPYNRLRLLLLTHSWEDLNKGLGSLSVAKSPRYIIFSVFDRDLSRAVNTIVRARTENNYPKVPKR